MRVSTKGRYGVRFMLDLSQHQEDGPVALRDIARRQAISEKYLWQVINPLKALGLVSSVRGAKGGFVLARPPAQITIRDIVSTLEGSTALVKCLDSPETCKRSGTCVAREMWEELEGKMSEAMGAITLQDMIDRQRAKDSATAVSFEI